MSEKVKVLLIEDEFIIAEELKEKLESYGYEVHGPMDNAEEAIKEIDSLKPDVCLVDINLEGKLNGLDFAEAIVDKNIAIIFLTALSDEKTLERAKSIGPAAYIIKPYEEKNLAVAIDLAFSQLSDSEKADEYLIADSFFIKENFKFNKVNLEDILYLEAKGSYTEIVTPNKKYTLSLNLKTISSKVDNSNFQRIHRSYVVNVSKIDAFDGNQVIIAENKIPIANSYREEFLKRFKFL